VEIDFSNSFYTRGPIRGEAFEGLDMLNYVDFGNSVFTTSTLPSQFLALPALEFFYFDNVMFDNDLQFTLDWIPQMPALFEAWLDFTPIGGGIPEEIGTATSLNSFSVSFCGLTGTIPTEMGNLFRMDRLWLYQNQLIGTIPSQIANMGRLMFFYTEGNLLSGSMPAEVCALRETLLAELGTDCEDGASNPVDCDCCTCCGEIECMDFTR
jgi:hypothetical protein